MFKSEGEMAIAISKDRVFECEDGWIMKFDPLCKEGCDSPFICSQSTKGQWYAMDKCWREYAKVKEIFPDLDAIKSCVINYLLGKKDFSADFVNELLALGDECFWIEGADGKPTRGFHLGSDFPSCSEVLDFEIKKQGDVYLAVEQGDAYV